MTRRGCFPQPVRDGGSRVRVEGATPRRTATAFACVLGRGGVGGLAGLGGNRGPEFAEVEGTVRLKGKPVDKMVLEFVPDSEKGTTGPNSIGYSDESGRYTLTSHTSMAGAVVGHHRVVVRDRSQF